MGNLGAYQEIVMQAKDAGGVEALIESIEKSAALRAIPKGFVAGVGLSAAVVVGVAAFRRSYAEREAAAHNARARLNREFNEELSRDEPSEGEPEAEDQTGDTTFPQDLT